MTVTVIPFGTDGGVAAVGQFDVMDFLGVWTSAPPTATSNVPQYITNPAGGGVLTASRVLWVAPPAGVVYYFEAALGSDDMTNHIAHAQLWDTNHNVVVAGSDVSPPVGAVSNPFYVRSGAINLVGGIEYAVKIYNATNGATTTITAARVIGVL